VLRRCRGPSPASRVGATVTDDGQPAPANLTYTWTQVSGPTTATITTATTEDTAVVGLAAGSYVFQLQASDGALSGSDTVQVIVGGTVVDAGTDQTVTQTGSSTVVQLAGVVTPATTVTWSGPTGVSFSNSASLSSTATFSGSGQYTLTLTASNVPHSISLRAGCRG
jgi:K319L-like, PKD domain